MRDETADDTTDRVKRFYEAYPYPNIDGERVGRATILGTAWCAVHHALDGRTGDRIRMLVAGGGTGVALEILGAAFAAEGVAPEIVYVDLSETSAEQARRRAERSGLRDVRFLVQPIESLADLGLAPFDYIDFSGVLNHVAEPAPVLDVLSKLVAPTGGMGVMAYGRLGRTGIYPMQNALRMLNGVSGAGDPIETMQTLLGELPPDNWISKNPHLVGQGRMDVVELADRYLNPNDRAFEIRELEGLLRAVGLEIRGFVYPFLYDPVPLMPTDALKAQARALSMIDRAQLAEWLYGNLHLHQVFAVPTGRPAPDPADLLARPETRLMPASLGAGAFEAMAKAAGMIVEIAMTYGAMKLGRKARFSDDACRVLGMLQDGPSVGRVRDTLAAEGVDRERADAAVAEVYRILSQMGALHLWAR
jgi:SAM-dependent methyltransferase